MGIESLKSLQAIVLIALEACTATPLLTPGARADRMTLWADAAK